MENNRLTAAEIEEIKMKIRQQVENTIGQVRQGNDINNINQPVQQQE